jgi:hypothetical protein
MTVLRARSLIALLPIALLWLGAGTPAMAQSAAWMPGPGAILENTYEGFIDVPTPGSTVPGSGSFTVSGWFVDRAAQGWAGADDVQVYLGQMGAGGTMIAHALVAQNRPDVAAALGNPYYAASGFIAAVPGTSVPSGPQTLNVYVHTGGKGWWFKQVNVTGGGAGTGTASAPSAAVPGAAPVVVIENPAKDSDVSTDGPYTITGTATDPGFGPSGIDKVEIWLNGERDTQYATLLGTVTPAATTGWQVTFTPTNFPSTHSNLYVYAHSRNTGKETLATREFNIVDD